jgi:hypothetical protein
MYVYVAILLGKVDGAEYSRHYRLGYRHFLPHLPSLADRRRRPGPSSLMTSASEYDWLKERAKGDEIPGIEKE